MANLPFTKNLLLFLTAILVITSSCAGQKTNDAEQFDETYPKDQIAQADTAYFASGCFWCTEAIFERIEGVGEVVSGYSGGTKPNPTYEEVARGQTDYAESVRVVYNSEVVSYSELVEMFYKSHDPTQLNRQGPDIGEQYRSAIFYLNNKQREIARDWKQKVDETDRYDKSIVTEITEFSNFYVAEDYHQNYYERHPNDRYIVNVSKPKVEKFEKEFKEKLKPEYRKEN